MNEIESGVLAVFGLPVWRKTQEVAASVVILACTLHDLHYGTDRWLIMTLDVEAVWDRLSRIEEAIRLLLQERVVRKFYSTADAAKILGKAEFTVREWCRHCRIRAEKRPCGRGNSKEWMISHEELERVQAEGLLSSKYSPKLTPGFGGASDCR